MIKMILDGLKTRAVTVLQPTLPEQLVYSPTYKLSRGTCTSQLFDLGARMAGSANNNDMYHIKVKGGYKYTNADHITTVTNIGIGFDVCMKMM